MTDPKKDEHIEELLSKLQGIFGKLSHSEEEEAKQTVEVPTPKEPKTKDNPPEKNAPPPMPINLYAEPEATPAAPASNFPAAPTDAPPPVTGEGTYETLVPTEDPERVIVPSAVYFPSGRDKEAKSLAGKLETMA